MNNDPNQKEISPRRGTLIFWVTVAAIVVVLFYMLFPEFGTRINTRAASARVGAYGLATALDFYYKEYGGPPVGDQAAMIRILHGDNPKRIVFFEFATRNKSPSGEFLDPWGSPYKIDLSDPAHPRVYSFGKNKQDEGGREGTDDIASWR